MEHVLGEMNTHSKDTDVAEPSWCGIGCSGKNQD